MDTQQKELTALQQVDQAIQEAQQQVAAAREPLTKAHEEDGALASQVYAVERALQTATTAEAIRQNLAEIDRLKGERGIMARLIANLEAEVKRRESVVAQLQENRADVISEANRAKDWVTSRQAEVQRQEMQYQTDMEALNNRLSAIQTMKSQIANAKQRVKALTGWDIGGGESHVR